LLVGGFGLCGIPENLIKAVLRHGVNNLNLISNECGSVDYGLGLLLRSHRVAKVTASFIGVNSIFQEQYLNGELEVNLIP